MKLSGYSSERTGDQVKITGTFRDAMRNPAGVKVVFEKGAENPSPIIASGNVRDVHGAIFAFADIAWGLGWRPRGLMGATARLIETYKLPPESK